MRIEVGTAENTGKVAGIVDGQEDNEVKAGERDSVCECDGVGVDVGVDEADVAVEVGVFDTFAQEGTSIVE